MYNRLMRIEVVCRGGYAGVTRKGTIDTSELDGPAAAAAEEAIRSLKVEQPAKPPSHPDSFQYEITTSESGKTRSVTVDEAHLPKDLRHVVDSALVRGGLV